MQQILKNREMNINKEKSLLWLKIAPNRSLTSEGTIYLFIFMAIGLFIPIIPFIGNQIGTTLTLFSGCTFYLFLYFLGKNFQAGQKSEEIKISQKKIQIIHKELNKDRLVWEGSTFWSRVIIEERNRKPEKYLTIKEKNRHIEVGSFLSPNERVDIKNKIENALARARLSC